MYNYTIMPLFDEYVEEICLDIKKQYEEGTADMALFCMTLVPEGKVPVDKVGEMCRKYDLFRDRLQKMGISCGVLVQASIGHGYPLGNMFGFTRYKNLNNGEEQNVCCPYDEGFRKHFKDVMATIASHSPAVIMLDDDFRLMFREGRGCFCDLHRDEFKRLSGEDIQREELYNEIKSDSERGKRYKEIFVKTQGDALIGAAKAMRAGIDSVDKTIPGVFCACGTAVEFAEDIAKILAGEGNPVIVRINNGNYMSAGARGLIRASYRAAVQMEVLKGKVDAILAETDTCPQNRYSTAAQSLHAHFTATILEGANGAKHWITRLKDYEPESGIAYRKKLAQNKGFYNYLAELAPSLEWVGARIPLSKKRNYYFKEDEYKEGFMCPGWAECVLEKLGLPVYFSSKSGGAVFMEGDEDGKFSDEEIKEMLQKTVFLASDTAYNLIKRGFGEYLGVDIEKYDGKRASFERLSVNNKKANAQKNIMKLILQGARADSVVYHMKDEKNCEELFPGSSVYKNSLGGTVVVFCGTPKTPFTFTEAFSFLTSSRKKQLVRLMAETGNLPVYYPEDAEIYLKAAKMPDKKLMTALFNVGLDSVYEIPLCVDGDIKRIEKLNSDGTLSECGFIKEAGGRLTVNTPCFTLEPVILFLEYKEDK